MTVSLTDYAGLRASVVELCERTADTAFTNNVPAMVLLAENMLNRELPAIELDVTLTGTINSRRLNIPSQSLTIETFLQPVALFLARTGMDEVMLDQQADGSFPYKSASGVPKYWAMDDGANIDFDCPLLEAYPFRFRSRQKLALATTDPNWLLTNHPDVYLSATIVEAANFMEDVPNLARWKGRLEESLGELKHTLAQFRRGTLSLDPMFGVVNRRTYNITTDT